MTKGETYYNILEEPRARKGMIERMEDLSRALTPAYFKSIVPENQKTIDDIRADFNKLIQIFKDIPVE